MAGRKAVLDMLTQHRAIALGEHARVKGTLGHLQKTFYSRRNTRRPLDRRTPHTSRSNSIAVNLVPIRPPSVEIVTFDHVAWPARRL